jgi:hypothetical protein
MRKVQMRNSARAAFDGEFSIHRWETDRGTGSARISMFCIRHRQIDQTPQVDELQLK